MKKLNFLIMSIMLLGAGMASAQTAFWNYDDFDTETQIPAECDGVFDDTRGGVFVPSPEEMAARGEEFLLKADRAERNKAGYCLIAAAQQGYVPAQYRVAQLYNKGIVLPQDDLSAYRWAFLASLNGHQEATRLALLLERFLTTQDIELATSAVQQMLPTISSRYKEELAEQQKRVAEKQQQLDAINEEIDKALGVKPQNKAERKSPLSEALIQAAKAVPEGEIFGEADRAE